MSDEEKFFVCERCGHAEMCSNPVLEELIKDEEVNSGLNKTFDILSKHITDMLMNEAIMKKLNPDELLSGDVLIRYELKLKKPTKDQVIAYLYKRLKASEEKGGEE